MRVKSIKRTGNTQPDLPRHSMAITEHAPLPMATLQEATHIVRYGNPAFCRLLGKSLAQLVGKPLEGLLPRKDICVPLLDRVFQSRRPESHTELDSSKPHPIFWSYTVWPLEATDAHVGIMIQVTETAKDHGKTVAMNEALVLGSLRQHELTEAAVRLNEQLHVEIIQRKRVEGTLRESEERFRTLFESGPVAVYSCNASGVIQDFNSHAAELWGRTPASGDTSERFCCAFKFYRADGSYMPNDQSPMAEVLSGKRNEIRDAEVIIERVDGSRLTVIVNIRLLKNKRGEITGAIHCLSDITERKQAEEVQRRLAVLAATNQKLELEIVQRRTAEKALKKSEQHQTRLLEESRGMQEQLRHMSRQVLQAQENERKRISRELHDVIAQTLTTINIQLAILKRDAMAENKDIGRNFERTQQLVENAMNIVHQFAGKLRPTMLDDLGLLPALQSFMKGFKEETGIYVSFTAFAASEQVIGDRRIVFYRVAQEALTNVARHAQANRVEVTIQKLDEAVRLTIKDDGKGFPAGVGARAKKSNRLGLLGMRERMEMVGGTFAIESVPGKGTTVTAQIPIGKTQTQLDHARSPKKTPDRKGASKSKAMKSK